MFASTFSPLIKILSFLTAPFLLILGAANTVVRLKHNVNAKEIVVNKETFLSKGKNTPFHGRKYFGEVMTTIRKGKIVYKALS